MVKFIWRNSNWAWRDSELKWAREVPQMRDVFCVLTSKSEICTNQKDTKYCLDPPIFLALLLLNPWISGSSTYIGLLSSSY